MPYSGSSNSCANDNDNYYYSTSVISTTSTTPTARSRGGNRKRQRQQESSKKHQANKHHYFFEFAVIIIIVMIAVVLTTARSTTNTFVSTMYKNFLHRSYGGSITTAGRSSSRFIIRHQQVGRGNSSDSNSIFVNAFSASTITSSRYYSTTTFGRQSTSTAISSSSILIADDELVDDDDNINNNWKESPLINPTIVLDTLLVPSSQLNKWISHPELQHQLAKPDNWDFLKHVHPRIKLIQPPQPNDDSDDNDRKRYKQLLLLPSSVMNQSTNNKTADDSWFEDLLSSYNSDHRDKIQIGPPLTMNITYKQLSYQYILNNLLPKEALPAPSSYEQIGHIAHFNLKPKHLPYKKLIGDALLETSTSIKTVVNKVGQVNGKYRTYECEILADNLSSSSSSSSSCLETTVIEDGVSIQLNVAKCYWSTRLSGERQELIKDILRLHRSSGSKTKTRPLVIADVFCGTGAVCLLLARKIKDEVQAEQKVLQQTTTTTITTFQEEKQPSLIVLANDWNQIAIDYMTKSIKLNGMGDGSNNGGSTNSSSVSNMLNFELSCRDSYDFISELGVEQQKKKKKLKTTNSSYKRSRKNKNKSSSSSSKNDNDDDDSSIVNEEEKEQERPLPDHILMNYPLEGPQFLGSLRWWSWKRLENEILLRDENNNDSNESWIGPRFHVYTFARSSTTPSMNDEEDMAVNIITNQLLPPIEQQQQQQHNDDNANEDNDNDDQSLSEPEKLVEVGLPVPVVYRRNEFNDEFNTTISTRLVRDVAPGKVVVCVSFYITPKLIRYMQGDYS
ncbi:Met_10-domain-containing protein [Fragilariopsis cylindrus CCMP1102]|uniref:tRNA (guanine(37)-N1)-methyltransferase n=1 Tax=Fragilariopsis cylindrus CCMP1102 TaxID=635003 RepID=A0A1E7F2Y9_9STRA|nr:Met_10-domain-containing protein [Fragilariopsis cylindrus CCMP1102]|eukprot:OEU12507.1 Met_10-domain-containing protein [Fragilariopsis cylindrus CCMP1102]